MWLFDADRDVSTLREFVNSGRKIPAGLAEGFARS